MTEEVVHTRVSNKTLVPPELAVYLGGSEIHTMVSDRKPLAPSLAAALGVRKFSTEQTLYVRRELQQAEEFIAWAKEQGFKTTLQPGDLHVTLAFSKTPLEWPQPVNDQVAVRLGSRSVEKLGEATVLRFTSSQLEQRWEELKEHGAIWDFPGYKPHITISWDAEGVDLEKVTPFAGPLVFGPEIFDEINPDWKGTITEKYSPSQPRGPKGTPEGGQWVSVSGAESRRLAQDNYSRWDRSDGKIVAWHGTSDEVIKDILKEGIKTHSHIWGFKGSVYVTNTFVSAIEWAGVVGVDPANVVAFQVRIPKRKWEKDFYGGPVHSNVDIPPEWIRAVYKPGKGGQPPLRLRKEDDNDHVMAFVFIVATGESLEKYSPEQPRDPKGSETGGQWRSVDALRGVHGYMRGKEDVPRGELDRVLAGKVELFHGTASDVVEDVRKGGLIPRAVEGADAWAATSGSRGGKDFISPATQTLARVMTLDGRQGSIFLTPDLGVAKRFAEMTSQFRGGKPIVFGLNIPRDKALANLHGDELSFEYRYQGSIPPAWINEVIKSDTVRMYMVLLVDGGVEKYSPNQPRAPEGTPEGGRWTDGGGGALKRYLEMTAPHSKMDAYILNNGKEYPFNKSSFIGGTPHRCFMNAALAVLDDPGLTYVEGYVSSHGVPLHHAWVVSKDGVVRDVTLPADLGERSVEGYYGVPIKPDFLKKALYRYKRWGMFGENTEKTLKASSSAVVQKYSPDQPRAPKGEPEGGRWTPKPMPSDAEIAARLRAGEQTLFHGTSSQAFESIRKHGLVPRGSPGADEWLMRDFADDLKAHGAPIGLDEIRASQARIDTDEPGRAASVYITPHPKLARDFAGFAAHVTHSEPVVLEIRVPPNAMGFKADEMAPGGGMRFEGKIPGDWIVGPVDLGKANDGLTLYAIIMVDGGPQDLVKYSPYQPRDWHGRWARGGYSPYSYIGTDGKLYTTSVEDAVRALQEGKAVELDHPRMVSTLLDKLRLLARKMEAAGEGALNINLCSVTIEGTSIFCVDSMGIPRIKMPQLKGVPLAGSMASHLTPDAKGRVDISEQFREYLVGKGFTMTSGEEAASYMKATQNELNGAMVASMAKALRQGKLAIGELFVSQESYIIDGHHRWASTIAVDTDDNRVGDILMPVVRVNADIITLLDEANDFAGKWGLPQVGMFKSFNPDQPRDPKGKPTGGQWSQQTGLGLDGTPIYFHGTRTEALDDIKSKGLVPSNYTGRPPNYTDELYQGEDHRSRSVFITDSVHQAKFYARTAAENTGFPGIKPLVLAISVPDNIEVDLDRDSLDASGYMVNHIPPEWIIDYGVVEGGLVEWKGRPLLAKAKLLYAVVLIQEPTKKYDPKQPRAPKGDPAGGQWTDIDGFRDYDDGQMNDGEHYHSSYDSGPVPVTPGPAYLAWEQIRKTCFTTPPTQAESDELNKFGAWGGDYAINMTLRGLNPRDYGVPDLEVRGVADRIALLTSVINKSSMPDNTVAYRGVGNLAWSIMLKQPGAVVGGTYTDPGFASVTLRSKLATGYTHAQGGSLIEVHMPKGTHAAPTIQGGGVQPQLEFVLQHGSRFKVKALSKHGMTVEVINDA